MKYIRWLLAYFTGILVLPLPGVLVAILETAIGSRICPVDQRVYEGCLAAWYPYASLAIALVAVTVGAALVVALPAWLAPAERGTVASFMFWAGTVLAVLLALRAGLDVSVSMLVLAAIASGWRVRRRFQALGAPGES